MNTIQTRRKILQNAMKSTIGLIATAAVSPLFLQACQKSCDKLDQSAAKPSHDIVPCPEQENLGEQDKAIRNSLRYVDATPIPARTCDNCKLYTLPVPSASCGGCKVVPGPIHPKGYCTAWLHLM